MARGNGPSLFPSPSGLPTREAALKLTAQAQPLPQTPFLVPQCPQNAAPGSLASATVSDPFRPEARFPAFPIPLAALSHPRRHLRAGLLPNPSPNP